jgi:hypothetical protein
MIKSRRMRRAGHIVRTGERNGAYGAFEGKPEGNKPTGRPRRKWENNIEIYLEEVAWGHGLD